LATRRSRSHALFAIAVLFGLTVALDPASAAAPKISGDWPQYLHGPEHDGFNPDETVLSPQTVQGLHVRWSLHGVPNTRVGDPLVAASKVFVTRPQGPGPYPGSEVDALDAATGAILWRFIRSTGQFTHDESVAGFAGGTLFVLETATCSGFNCHQHFVDAVDATTGVLRWSVQFQRLGSWLVVSGHTVYVSDGYYEVALSPANGRELWRSDVGAPITFASVGEGLLFVPAADLKVHALDAVNGKEVWAAQMASYVWTAAAYSAGSLYVPDASETLTALDASTGQIRWSVPTSSNGPACLAVALGDVYFGDDLGNFVALHASDGQELWSTKLSATGSSAGCPAVADGVIYVPHGGIGALDAVDASDGHRLWPGPAGSGLPVVSNGMLFVSTFDDWGGVSTLVAFGL
jgi:outer membrane protein assembly factor BamB